VNGTLNGGQYLFTCCPKPRESGTLRELSRVVTYGGVPDVAPLTPPHIKSPAPDLFRSIEGTKGVVRRRSGLGFVGEGMELDSLDRCATDMAEVYIVVHTTLESKASNRNPHRFNHSTPNLPNDTTKATSSPTLLPTTKMHFQTLLLPIFIALAYAADTT
jgi:hypothetical protein